MALYDGMGNGILFCIYQVLEEVFRFKLTNVYTQNGEF